MSTMKKVLALTLALVMALSFASFGYTDEADINVADVEAVKLLTSLNVITGYTDDTFRPNGLITRAEAAKMIYVICNRGVDDKAVAYTAMPSMFTDVAESIWYEGYVNYCASVDIIAGRTATTFDPLAHVTGYELAKMLLVVAEYDPTIQGYGAGATDWQNCVWNDASKAYMLQDLDAMMTMPITRENAAKMMYNTLLNVGVAQYIGDLLVSGTMLGSGNQLTVGQKRMGLEVVTGTITAVNNVKLGTDTDKSGITGDEYITVDVTSDENADDLEFVWEANEALLGHQVKVVLKKLATNNEIGTGVDYNEDIYGVYGMYETGRTKVYNTTVDAITASTTNNTIKFVGFNGDKAKSHTNNIPAVYFNDFETRDNMDEMTELAAYFGTNRAFPVKAVDTNGDGKIDHMFITETFYGKVQQNNGTTAFLADEIGSGNGSITIIKAADYEADLNLIGEVKAGDIIAVTENYLSSELVYDIKAVAPTAVTASAYTYLKINNQNTGIIEKVKLDGTYYERAVEAVKTFTELNHADEVYYIDNGYVVFSAEQGITQAPTNVAIVLDVSVTPTDGYVVDNWTNSKTYSNPITVQFLAQDGKIYKRNYHVPKAAMNDPTVIGAANSVYGSDDAYVEPKTSTTTISNPATVFEGNDTIRTFLATYGASNVFEYVEDGTNVYLRVLNSDTDELMLPADAALYGADAAVNGVKFVNSNDTLHMDSNTILETSADTFFFVKYSTNKWTVVKAADLLGNIATADAIDVVRLGDYTVAYGLLDLGSAALPAVSATINLAWLTGEYEVSEIANNKHTAHLEAKNMADETITLDVILTGSATLAEAKAQVAVWMQTMQHTLVSYTFDADGYAQLAKAVTTGYTGKNGTIGFVTDKSFRIGNDLLINYNEKTVVITVALNADNEEVYTITTGKPAEAAQSWVLYSTDKDVHTAAVVLVNLAYDQDAGTREYTDFILSDIPAVNP